MNITAQASTLMPFLMKNHHIWEKYHSIFELWLQDDQGRLIIKDFATTFDHWISTDPHVEMPQDIYDVIMSFLNDNTSFVQYCRMLNHYASRWVILQQGFSQTIQLSLPSQPIHTAEITSVSITKMFPTIPQEFLTAELLRTFQNNINPRNSTTIKSSQKLLATKYPVFNTLTLPQLSEHLSSGLIPDFRTRLDLYKSLSPEYRQKENLGDCIPTLTLPIPIENDIPYKQVETVIAGAFLNCQEAFLSHLLSSPLYIHAFDSIVHLFIRLYNRISPQQAIQLPQQVSFLGSMAQSKPSSVIPTSLILHILRTLLPDGDSSPDQTLDDLSIDQRSQLTSFFLWAVDLYALWTQQTRLIANLFPFTPSADNTLANIVTASTSQILKISKSPLPNSSKPIDPPNPPKQELIGVLSALFIFASRLFVIHDDSYHPINHNLNLSNIRQLVTIVAYLNATLEKSEAYLSEQIKLATSLKPTSFINQLLQLSPYVTLLLPHPLIKTSLSFISQFERLLPFSKQTGTDVLVLSTLPIPLTLFSGLKFPHSQLETNLALSWSNFTLPSLTSDQITAIKQLLGPMTLFSDQIQFVLREIVQCTYPTGGGKS
jgi:hypothetical protein